MDITEQLTHESRIALAAVAEIIRLRAENERLKADAAKLRTLLAVVPLPPETISLEFGWAILNVIQAVAAERAAQGERG